MLAGGAGDYDSQDLSSFRGAMMGQDLTSCAGCGSCSMVSGFVTRDEALTTEKADTCSWLFLNTLGEMLNGNESDL